MTPDPRPSPSAPPPIGSRSEFSAALLWGIETAVARPARQMWWVDSDFSDWPLSDSGLLDCMTSWLRLPQRRLVLLASDYGQVPRAHPRFMRWRADWSHAIEAWTPPDDVGLQLPRLLLDDGPVCVHLMDALRWRGRATHEARTARTWREEVEAVLQRSSPAFPVRTLGL